MRSAALFFSDCRAGGVSGRSHSNPSILKIFFVCVQFASPHTQEETNVVKDFIIDLRDSDIYIYIYIYTHTHTHIKTNTRRVREDACASIKGVF